MRCCGTNACFTSAVRIAYNNNNNNNNNRGTAHATWKYCAVRFQSAIVYGI